MSKSFAAGPSSPESAVSRQRRRAEARRAAKQSPARRPVLRPSIVSVAAAAAALGGHGTARAATYSVTTLLDSGAGSLRQAIEDANANPGADTVIFTGGGASGTITLDTQIIIDDDITITGPGQAALTITTDGDNRMFYLYVADQDDLVVSISGLTFEGGSDFAGGAIFADAYTDYRGYPYYDSFPTGTLDLTVTDSTFYNNQALYGDGGAIDADLELPDAVTVRLERTTFLSNGAQYDGGAVEVEGTLTVLESSFQRNRASYNGGAIAIDDSSSTDLLIENSIFADNRAGYDGGALYMEGDGATIRDAEFRRNLASRQGGAILLYDMDDPVLLERVLVVDNSAEDGGGIYLYDGDANVVLRNVQVRDNYAEEDGGGILLYSPDSGDGEEVANSITIVDSTIADNDADRGGGLWMLYDSNGELPAVVDIVNSTISGNDADRGGGLWVGHDGEFPGESPPLDLRLRHVTLANNTAFYGGGGLYLAYDWTVTVENSVLADSSPNDLESEDGSFDLSFSLVEDSGTATIVDSGGNVIGQDAALGALQINGGVQVGSPALGSPEALLTQLPGATSLAVNAGDPAFADPAVPNDERGAAFPRVLGGRLDMGAVETPFGLSVLEIPALGGVGRIAFGGLCLLAAVHFLRKRRLAPGALAILLASGALRLEAAPADGGNAKNRPGLRRTGEAAGSAGIPQDRKVAATVVSANGTEVVFRLADGSLVSIANGDLKANDLTLPGAVATDDDAQAISTGLAVEVKRHEERADRFIVRKRHPKND